MERGAKWRPAVAAFADLMEARLREHDDRRGGDTWANVRDPLHLANRIMDNTTELVAKLCEWMTPGMFDAKPDNLAIMRQAADVGNFAMMVADRCGPLPAPLVEAIVFRISSELIEYAHAIDGGLEVQIEGPDNVLVHVIDDDFEGVQAIAAPIEVDTVAETVREVRELIDADDRNAASSCGVRDRLAVLEGWLTAYGVDVEARCYPPASSDAADWMSFDAEPANPTRKHE